MKFLKLHIRLLIVLMLIGVSTEALAQTKMQESKSDTVTVYVLGTNTDSRFEPATVRVKPGDIIHFIVKEGIHTVTAYHPDNRRYLGIPEGAASFDSGILTAGDTWSLTITHTGDYNYFCMPHERMGHVGKIISNNTTDSNTK